MFYQDSRKVTTLIYGKKLSGFREQEDAQFRTHCISEFCYTVYTNNLTEALPFCFTIGVQKKFVHHLLRFKLAQC